MKTVDGVIVGKYLSGFCNTEDQATDDAHAKCPVTVKTPSGTYMCKCPNHPNDIPKKPVDVCLDCRAGDHETCEAQEMKLCRCYENGHDDAE